MSPPRIDLRTLVLLLSMAATVCLVALGTQLAARAGNTAHSAAQAATAQAPEGGAPASLDPRYTVLAPVVHKGVALYGVRDTKAPQSKSGDYVLLADALSNGDFEVLETDASGDVPTLMVHNTGTKSVLLTAGDVVAGGKQDRVIVADVVVEPSQEPVPIAVNCVEQGRWKQGQTGLQFAYAGRGEFDLKRTLQKDKSQGATWEKVAQLNASKGANLGAGADLAPESGTYMASLKAGPVVDMAKDRTQTLLGALPEHADVVGVIVAVDGKLVGAELYGHPRLFEKSREAVVRSVVLDGISQQASDAPAPPATEAAAFLADAMTGNETATEVDGKARKSSREGLQSLGYITEDESGEVLHLNVYTK